MSDEPADSDPGREDRGRVNPAGDGTRSVAVDSDESGGEGFEFEGGDDEVPARDR